MEPSATLVNIPLLNPNEPEARIVSLVIQEGQFVEQGDPGPPCYVHHLNLDGCCCNWSLQLLALFVLVAAAAARLLRIGHIGQLQSRRKLPL